MREDHMLVAILNTKGTTCRDFVPPVLKHVTAVHTKVLVVGYSTFEITVVILIIPTVLKIAYTYHCTCDRMCQQLLE